VSPLRRRWEYSQKSSSTFTHTVLVNLSNSKQPGITLNPLKQQMFSRGIQKKTKKDLEREAEERKRIEEEKCVSQVLTSDHTTFHLTYQLSFTWTTVVEQRQQHSKNFKKLSRGMSLIHLEEEEEEGEDRREVLDL
jgi:hypothetical protein